MGLRRSRGSFELVLLAVTASLLAVALPASASAAEPVWLGSGSDVKAATSPDGTTHLVWHAGSPRQYVYCRIPLGASACDRTETWSSPGGPSSLNATEPGVFALSNTRIVIAQYWCCGDTTHVVASDNGGDSFTPLEFLAGQDGTPGAVGRRGTGESVYGPGDTITAVDGYVSISGPFVQSSPLESVTYNSTSGLGSNWVLDSSLGFVGGKAVIGWIDQDGAVVYRTADDSADLNDTASWSPELTAVPPTEFGTAYLNIATGPSGLFMLYDLPVVGPTVVKWNGSGFGSPSTVSESGTFSDISQDPSGRLHVVWGDNGLADDIFYSSSANGSNWSAPVMLAENANPVNIQPAFNSLGQGVIAYDVDFGDPSGVFFVRTVPPPILAKKVNVEPVKGKGHDQVPGREEVHPPERGRADPGRLPRRYPQRNGRAHFRQRRRRRGPVGRVPGRPLQGHPEEGQYRTQAGRINRLPQAEEEALGLGPALLLTFSPIPRARKARKARREAAGSGAKAKDALRPKASTARLQSGEPPGWSRTAATGQPSSGSRRARSRSATSSRRRT